MTFYLRIAGDRWNEQTKKREHVCAGMAAHKPLESLVCFVDAILTPDIYHADVEYNGQCIAVYRRSV